MSCAVASPHTHSRRRGGRSDARLSRRVTASRIPHPPGYLPSIQRATPTASSTHRHGRREAVEALLHDREVLIVTQVPDGVEHRRAAVQHDRVLDGRPRPCCRRQVEAPYGCGPLDRSDGEGETPFSLPADHDRCARPTHAAGAVAGGEAVADRRRVRAGPLVPDDVQDFVGVHRQGHDVAHQRVGPDRVGLPEPAHWTAAPVVPAAGDVLGLSATDRPVRRVDTTYRHVGRRAGLPTRPPRPRARRCPRPVGRRRRARRRPGRTPAPPAARGGRAFGVRHAVQRLLDPGPAAPGRRSVPRLHVLLDSAARCVAHVACAVVDQVGGSARVVAKRGSTAAHCRSAASGTDGRSSTARPGGRARATSRRAPRARPGPAGRASPTAGRRAATAGPLHAGRPRPSCLVRDEHRRGRAASRSTRARDLSGRRPGGQRERRDDGPGQSDAGGDEAAR